MRAPVWCASLALGLCCCSAFISPAPCGVQTRRGRAIAKAGWDNREDDFDDWRDMDKFEDEQRWRSGRRGSRGNGPSPVTEQEWRYVPDVMSGLAYHSPGTRYSSFILILTVTYPPLELSTIPALLSKPSMQYSPQLGLPKSISKALLAGIFVLGIGTGVTVDSAINTNPRDLASRDAIDRNAPNADICQMYGASAMVLDNRVFVTFNPFAVHVTQADVKPGCVLRQSNVVEVLQRRNLLNRDEVETCKMGSNTWAYVGDLNKQPQLSCVYQSDDAQNEFLSDPKVGLGEDVYDDDKLMAARAAKKASLPSARNSNGNDMIKTRN